LNKSELTEILTELASKDLAEGADINDHPCMVAVRVINESLTKESAQELCEALEVNGEFFDEENEEYILLEANNPRQLRAFEEIFTIANE